MSKLLAFDWEQDYFANLFYRLKAMQFDRQKLKEVILYISNKCDASELGAVKMHKVLYFADMISYTNFGKPLTGASYFKRPFGPTCDSLLSAIRELEIEDSLETNTIDYFGYNKKVYIPRRDAEEGRFTSQELMLLDDIIDFVCRKNTATTISELSHKLPWELAEFGEEISYSSAFQLFPEEVSEETLDWAKKEISTLETEGSNKETVELKDISLLRGKLLQAGR